MILHVPDSHLHSLPSNEEITTHNTYMRRISTLQVYMKNNISSTPELCDISKLIEIVSNHNDKLKKH
jgi:hypothetical protein